MNTDINILIEQYTAWVDSVWLVGILIVLTVLLTIVGVCHSRTKGRLNKSGVFWMGGLSAIFCAFFWPIAIFIPIAIFPFSLGKILNYMIRKR